MKQAELHYTAQNSPWPQQNKVMSTQTVNTSGNSPHLTFSSTYHPALFWTGRRFQSAAGGPFFFLLLIKTGQHATVYVKHILLKVTKVIANTKEEVFTKGRNKPSGVRASRSTSTQATAQLFLLSVQKCETKYLWHGANTREPQCSAEVMDLLSASNSRPFPSPFWSLSSIYCWFWS